MDRKLHPDGVCQCCGRVGPTWEAVSDPADPGPLCDRCEYARCRWDAAHAPGPYPYLHPPPKSPPPRRAG